MTEFIVLLIVVCALLLAASKTIGDKGFNWIGFLTGGLFMGHVLRNEEHISILDTGDDDKKD